MRVLAVTNFYPTPRHPTSGTFVEQQVIGLRRCGLDVDVMHVDRHEKGMRSYFTMGAELRSRVEQFRPDVVHAMYGGVLAERVTRIVEDRPAVVSFCGSDLLGEYLSGPIRRICSEYGIWASYVAARRAVGIIVKSRNLKEALPAAVIHSKVRIIPNGIDLKRFKPIDQADCRRKLDWDPNRFHVLFPANVGGDPRKRLYLARAAVDNANRSGLKAELHQLRGVPHEEVPIWLNASDVVLLTSLHEGSPNIIKEALACDISVISVDVGDVRERIDGIEGCHIALPDPNDLGVKLSLVAAKKRRIAGHAKMQFLSLEQTAMNLNSFYREVVESYQRQDIASRRVINHSLLIDFCLSISRRRKHFGGQPKRH